MRYRFLTCDVFTERRFGGNQLAVLPDAEGLADAQMQAIAAEFNYSETTFVLPPTDPAHLARVRIFTPRFEMPFAGHPDGRHGARRWHGWVVCRTMVEFVLEEQAGPVPVRLRPSDGPAAFAEFSAPQAATHGAPLPVRSLAVALGLEPADLVTVGRACHASPSCGAPFLLVELASLAALARATLDARAELPEWRGRGAPVHPGRPAMLRSTSVPACSRPRMASPRIPRRGVRLRHWPAIWPGGPDLADGWHRLAHRAGDRDGPAEPDRRRAPRRSQGTVAEVRIGGTAVPRRRGHDRGGCVSDCRAVAGHLHRWPGPARGARAILPIVPGAVAFGLVYGFLAGERGLSALEIGLTSMLVFAGASQFLALELWGDPLPLVGLVLGVLVINLRHLLMGPALLPWLAKIPPGAGLLPASTS